MTLITEGKPEMMRATQGFVLLLLIATLGCHQLQFNDSQEDSKTSATDKRAMAVSDKPAIAAIGIEVLSQGGNAIDAAVAMSFAVSVLAPQSTGIGGGGFLLYRPSGKDTPVSVYDFRARAPATSNRTMFVNRKVPFPKQRHPTAVTPQLERPSLNGHLSVGVPGLVAGVLKVHKRYGKSPLKTLLKPSIDLAQKGFKVYPHLATSIRQRQKVLKHYPASRELFLPQGIPLQTGDVLVQKDLARVIETIAEKGHKGFYEGWVAQAIQNDMKTYGGRLTAQDLKDVRIIQREPVIGTYRGHTIHTMPPPSSGGTHLIQMLNMLETVDLSSYKPQTAPYVHLLSEVMRRAYYDRSQYLGDPAFNSIPLKGLLSKDYATQLATQIKREQATPSSTLPLASPMTFEKPSTTNFVVVDQHGNAVVSTQSVNARMGSGVVVPGTGILLNDTMDDFSIAPGVPNTYGLVGGKANEVAGRKTPLSSMTPTMITKDGKLVLALGAPGGSTIITAVLQTVLHKIDFKMNLEKAVALKRVHHQFLPDVIQFEEGTLSEKAQKKLQKKGHKLKARSLPSKVSAIAIRPDGTLVGAADPKSHGTAAGWLVE